MESTPDKSLKVSNYRLIKYTQIRSFAFVTEHDPEKFIINCKIKKTTQEEEEKNEKGKRMFKVARERFWIFFFFAYKNHDCDVVNFNSSLAISFHCVSIVYFSIKLILAKNFLCLPADFFFSFRFISASIFLIFSFLFFFFFYSSQFFPTHFLLSQSTSFS